MPTYDVDDFVSHVRVLLPGVTKGQYSDDSLAEIASLALRRMNRDKPVEATYVLTGDGGKWYDLSDDSLLGAKWVNGQSTIKKIYRPTQGMVSGNKDPELIYQSQYDIIPTDDGQERLWLAQVLTETQQITIVYKSGYVLKGVNGSLLTTVPFDSQAALEYLGAALTCYAMSSKAASTVDSDLPADIISYRSKQMEYQRAGQNWEAQYAKELGIGKDVPVVAAGMKNSYHETLQSGLPYMTHDLNRR